MTEISPVKYLDVLHKIGLDAVKKIRKEFGGTTFYVRKSRSHESFGPLSLRIGKRKAELLRKELGGTTFLYPAEAYQGKREKRYAECREIRRMYKFGISVNDLSVMYGMGTSQIEKIIDYPNKINCKQDKIKHPVPEQKPENVQVVTDIGTTREDVINYFGLKAVVETENELLKDVEEYGKEEVGIEVELDLENGSTENLVIFCKYRDDEQGEYSCVARNDDMYFEYEIS